MDGHDAEDPKQNDADMTVFVQNLLQQMIPDNVRVHHFEVDEMGNRIDDLEQSINDLGSEMCMDSSASPSLPSKSKDEPQGSQ